MQSYCQDDVSGSEIFTLSSALSSTYKIYQDFDQLSEIQKKNYRINTFLDQEGFQLTTAKDKKQKYYSEKQSEVKQFISIYNITTENDIYSIPKQSFQQFIQLDDNIQNSLMQRRQRTQQRKTIGFSSSADKEKLEEYQKQFLTNNQFSQFQIQIQEMKEINNNN